jgi:hypothetical protein
MSKEHPAVCLDISYGGRILSRMRKPEIRTSKHIPTINPSKAVNEYCRNSPKKPVIGMCVIITVKI